MADETDAVLMFGDDLEAILDVLEEDERIHECEKSYKTKGGYETQDRKTWEHRKKKGDVEKFYSNFYGTVALNATKYFKGLTRNAATLLATKVADTMIANSKKQKLSSIKQ
ncbi:hypothetical protein AWC38_SpisGene4156 [Stylophora pistillata]|uniref:Uncharacterized protein n=1 Tax=Stylophora pistillata TaxID=50429 RepID=A0A2B4SRC0_STYPI|nr:hypothetical protein AWC38_SpisGene4156 [Stylophora pistillata]